MAIDPDVQVLLDEINARIDALQCGVSVLDFGAVGDGVADDSTAIQQAADAATAADSNLHFPSGRVFHLESQVVVTAPPFRRMLVQGYGAEVTTTGPISGLKFAGGSTTGGVSVHGLKVNHRDNAQAVAGFELTQTWNARLRDCTVVAHGVADTYAAFAIRNGDPSNPSTGSFWTTLDSCWVRKRSGTDNGAIPIGVLLEGAANATSIRGGGLNNVQTGILHRAHPGEFYIANALLVDGVAFEGYDTAYQMDGPASGVRFWGNRFENGSTVFSIRGPSAVPPVFIGNHLLSNAGDYIHNPDDAPYASFEISITPTLSDAMHWDQPTFIGSLQGADMPLQVRAVGGARGIELLNGAGERVWLIDWSGTGKSGRIWR